MITFHIHNRFKTDSHSALELICNLSSTVGSSCNLAPEEATKANNLWLDFDLNRLPKKKESQVCNFDVKVLSLDYVFYLDTCANSLILQPENQKTPCGTSKL